MNSDAKHTTQSKGQDGAYEIYGSPTNKDNSKGVITEQNNDTKEVAAEIIITDNPIKSRNASVESRSAAQSMDRSLPGDGSSAATKLIPLPYRYFE